MIKSLQLIIIGFLLTTALSGCKASIDIFPTKKPTNLGITIAWHKGTVFTADYPTEKLKGSGINLAKRFTPTKADIEIFQSIFIQQVVGHGRSHIGHYKDYPYKASGKHFMQFAGFINERGEKVLHINFLYNQDNAITYEDDYKTVLDGGDHYWQLDVNLTTQQVIDLRVNGVG
ncbi:hypothetical protein [Mucilaginibacter sp.]|uniref:hypothetical protein n=1 Tax=Mucilaginibacter sp. TaxID=1882438 RepID=UPI0026197A07|nr:hypothetical protein [Mucilaginibacter sp.]